jgi:RHS repeat-associated protein
MYFIHPDHLNTPRMIANQAGVTVWRNDNTEPFGNSVPNSDPGNTGIAFDFPLRFPGQYADKETNTHYNYFRDYDPAIGRYSKSDPIGLRGGLNTYAYVKGNPLRLVDPMGEAEWEEWGRNPGGSPGLGDKIPRGPLPRVPISPSLDTLILEAFGACARVLAGPVGVIIGMAIPSPIGCDLGEDACKVRVDPGPSQGTRD